MKKRSERDLRAPMEKEARHQLPFAFRRNGEQKGVEPVQFLTVPFCMRFGRRRSKNTTVVFSPLLFPFFCAGPVESWIPIPFILLLSCFKKKGMGSWLPHTLYSSLLKRTSIRPLVFPSHPPTFFLLPTRTFNVAIRDRYKDNKQQSRYNMRKGGSPTIKYGEIRVSVFLHSPSPWDGEMSSSVLDEKFVVQTQPRIFNVFFFLFVVTI